MNNHHLQALEAVLFAGGEPIPLDKITEAMELDEQTVLALIVELSARLEQDDSGIQLVRLEDCYQLCTKAEYAPYVKRAFEIRRNTPLSQAALEVLAVVAYNQPVTKAFIEQVRGVDCSGVLSSLNEKGLIEEKGRLDLPGRPLLYGTTPVFLRCFGLSSLEDLPPLPGASEESGTEEQVENRPSEGSGKRIADLLKEVRDLQSAVISGEAVHTTDKES